jgi:hypothetical protein
MSKKTETAVVVMDMPVAQQALAASVKRINELVAAIKSDVERVGELGVSIGNHAIQLGLFLQEATGRQQLELRLFTALAGISEDLSFEMASRCVSLANRKGAGFKFKSFAEVQPELGLLFQGMKLIEGPRRQISAGAPVQTNWGAWIPQVFTPVNNGLQELIAAEPMDGWNTERLETFMAQSLFVHDQHERAAGLLKKTV